MKSFLTHKIVYLKLAKERYTFPEVPSCTLLYRLDSGMFMMHVNGSGQVPCRSLGDLELGTYLEAMNGVMSSSSGNETYVVIFRLSLAECSNRWGQSGRIFYHLR